MSGIVRRLRLVQGTWTDGDLAAFIANKDFIIGVMRTAYEAQGVAWQAKDAAAQAAWSADWEAFLARYTPARLEATQTLDQELTTDQKFEGVLRAVQQVANTRTKGDLSDLFTRLQAFTGPLDVSKAPQPSQTTSDKFLQATAEAEKAVKSGVSFGGNALLWVAIAYVVSKLVK